jgi:hypothetical protein
VNSVEIGIPGGFETQPRNFTVKQAGGKELAVEKMNRFKKRNTSKGVFDSLFLPVPFLDRFVSQPRRDSCFPA